MNGMPQPSRRALLGLGAAAAVAALSACAPPVVVLPTLAATPSPTPVPTPAATPSATAAPEPEPAVVEPVEPAPPPPQAAPSLAKVPAPSGTITALPGDGSLLAWTVDDGTSTEVIAAYAAFAAASGIRLTMFVTGTYLASDRTSARSPRSSPSARCSSATTRGRTPT